MILGLAVAALAAAAYGVSDYFGGLSSRRIGSAATTLVTYIVSGALMIAVALVVGGEWGWDVVGPGVVAGISGVIGIAAFYEALVRGPVAIMSPLIAVLQSVVPVATGLLIGQTLNLWAWAAIGLAILATALLTSSRRNPGSAATSSSSAVVLALISGLGSGVAIVALDAAPSSSGVNVGVIESGIAVLALMVVFSLRRTRAGSPRRMHQKNRARGHVEVAERAKGPRWAPMFTAVGVVAGALMGLGNAALIIALQTGEVAVVGVIVGLYPLPTIVLGRLLLHESVSVPQWLGIATALLSCALFGLSGN